MVYSPTFFFFYKDFRQHCCTPFALSRWSRLRPWKDCITITYIIKKNYYENKTITNENATRGSGNAGGDRNNFLELVFLYISCHGETVRFVCGWLLVNLLLLFGSASVRSRCRYLMSTALPPLRYTPCDGWLTRVPLRVWSAVQCLCPWPSSSDRLAVSPLASQSALGRAGSAPDYPKHWWLTGRRRIAPSSSVSFCGFFTSSPYRYGRS